MSMLVRRMERGDIAAVQTVARTTWKHTYHGVIPDAVQAEFLDRAYSRETLQRRMRRGIFFVALHTDRVVGFANFLRTNDTAELAALYVLPELQGQGAGSHLLQAGLASMPDLRRLYLRVERDNQRGRHFYEARGFRYVGDLHEQFGGHTLHLLEMVLHIAP